MRTRLDSLPRKTFTTFAIFNTSRIFQFVFEWSLLKEHLARIMIFTFTMKAATYFKHLLDVAVKKNPLHSDGMLFVVLTTPDIFA